VASMMCRGMTWRARPGRPYSKVPDLVRNRRVYMAAGQAFVPRDQLASLVVGAFRMRLSKALVVASRRWAQHVSGEEKDRLAPVVGFVSRTCARHFIRYMVNTDVLR